MVAINRRHFLTTAAAASLPSTLYNQRLYGADLPKVGILHPGPKGPIPSVDAVVNGMGGFGYQDGKTVTLEYRYAGGQLDQLPVLSKDLVDQSAKVIVAVAGEALVAAAQVTKTVPIVSATAGGDFVAMGLIKSWERPGTNVTGMNLIADDAAIARVEMLKKALPTLRTVAVLANLSYPGNDELLSAMQGAARKLNVKLLVIQVSKVDDLEGAIASGKQEGADAIATLQGPFFFFQRKLLAELALKHKTPLAMSEALSAEAGAMLQVNPNVPGCANRSAIFIDKILRGENPGGLRIERYSEYDVVINLKTAKELGIGVNSDTIKAVKVIQ
jgi:putative ABC transport system substrate-binding protein